jgi:NADPH-dependent 2,4-dienoyl-CoA reductase/sulfur reductase-like enzyme
MNTVVVGAGPAGVRAVETLLQAGIRPIWLDEARDGGGRVYQRPPSAIALDAAKLYGFEAVRAQSIHRTFEQTAAQTDWRPGTLVWQVRAEKNVFEVRTLTDGLRHGRVLADRLLLCTGATERIVPIPGWTLPGVTTLGGAQIALKTQNCAIGSRVSLVGTGPLLWLLAHQYVKAGVTVAALIDTTAARVKRASAWPMLRYGAATLAKGLVYLFSARRGAQQVYEGAVPLAIEGTDHVSGLRWRDDAGREHRVDCDAVAMGWGLRPESQLADLAGIPFHFDHLQRQWLPTVDAAGRSPVAGVYCAGDGASIGGAEVAELAGARAAWAMIADRAGTVDTQAVSRLDQALARQARLRAALELAFPYPAALAASVDDDTILCRCESLTAGMVRAAAAPSAPTGAARELNRAKAVSRLGMGRCQGRMCASAAAEVLASVHQIQIAEVGRLRAQPPVRPIPMVVQEETT